jgi:hypothetical protein
MTAIIEGRSAVNLAPYPTDSPRRMPFTATMRLLKVMTGLSGIVERSGGGATPYNSKPGRA